VHVDDFEPQGGDPLHEPGKGGGIREFGTESCRARADADVAVIEFRLQYRARLAGEGDLINKRFHLLPPLNLPVCILPASLAGRG
jgi:hypothetical protein